MARGSVVVEALYYKPEGRGFETQWGNWILQFTKSFQLHYALGVTPPVTEMRTGNWKIIFLESRARPVRKVDILIAICVPII
jgi:hypothetical protein